MKNLRNCNVYPTDKANWGNFEETGYRNISDFVSWALKKAFKQIGLANEKGHNNWYWSDGHLTQEIYKGESFTDSYELCVTDNGILFIRHYVWSNGDCEQTEQAVIDPKL